MQATATRLCPGARREAAPFSLSFSRSRASSLCFIRSGRREHVLGCRAQKTQEVNAGLVDRRQEEASPVDRTLAEPGKLFDRKEELAFLKRFATDRFRRGRLLLLAGPRNCGKTAILKQLAKDVPDGVVLVNLRVGDAGTPHGFLVQVQEALVASDLTGKLIKFFKEAWEAVAGEATLSIQDPKTGGVKLDKLIQPHIDFQKVFRRYLEKHPERLITLVLDEANLLQAWLSDKVSEHTLDTYLHFFVHITKESSLANVVLVSSDFFLKFWLKDRIGADRFSCHVIGDFPEPVARSYFECVLGKACPDVFWNSIYAMFGGAPLHLRTTAASILGDGEAWKEEVLQVYYQVQDQTDMGLSPDSIAPRGIPPSWTREEFVKVLTEMAKHEKGVVPWTSLTRRFGMKVLKALICYSFIQYRTTSTLAKDVAWYKGKWPIVMPVSQFHWLTIKQLVAMEQGKLSDEFGWTDLMMLAGVHEEDQQAGGAGV